MQLATTAVRLAISNLTVLSSFMICEWNTKLILKLVRSPIEFGWKRLVRKLLLKIKRRLMLVWSMIFQLIILHWSVMGKILACVLQVSAPAVEEFLLRPLCVFGAFSEGEYVMCCCFFSLVFFGTFGQKGGEEWCWQLGGVWNDYLWCSFRCFGQNAKGGDYYQNSLLKPCS